MKEPTEQEIVEALKNLVEHLGVQRAMAVIFEEMNHAPEKYDCWLTDGQTKGGFKFPRYHGRRRLTPGDRG